MAAVGESSIDASEANDCCLQFPLIQTNANEESCMDTVENGTLHGNISGYCCSRKRRCQAGLRSRAEKSRGCRGIRFCICSRVGLSQLKKKSYTKYSECRELGLCHISGSSLSLH